MNENKVLDGLDYISIIFAPFLFPFIVWLLTSKGTESHYHAGRAFKLHLIPVILSIVFLFAFGLGAVFTNGTDSGSTALGVGGIIGFLFVGIVDVGFAIYNIYYGIKMFLS